MLVKVMRSGIFIICLSMMSEGNDRVVIVIMKVSIVLRFMFLLISVLVIGKVLKILVYMGMFISIVMGIDYYLFCLSMVEMMFVGI